MRAEHRAERRDCPDRPDAVVDAGFIQRLRDIIRTNYEALRRIGLN